MKIAKASLLIDDSLWYVLFGIQSVSNSPLKGSVVKAIFTDCESDQVSAKEYVIAATNKVRIIGTVDEYEADFINLSLESTSVDQEKLDKIIESAKTFHFLKNSC